VPSPIVGTVDSTIDWSEPWLGEPTAMVVPS
jgi:hypothetical protein